MVAKKDNKKPENESIEEKNSNPVKMEVSPKVQTAEGWRRAKLKESKEGKK